MTLSLPQPEVPDFSGDPMEFCEFLRALETIIEVKMQSESTSLYYLIQHRTGDVKELMRSCLTMNLNEGYKTGNVCQPITTRGDSQ
jgi:hypothetical protein